MSLKKFFKYALAYAPVFSALAIALYLNPKLLDGSKGWFVAAAFVIVGVVMVTGALVKLDTNRDD